MRSNELSLDQKISMDRLCYLFLIFLAGCLIGWFYEEIFYWITEGILRNRGILYGPCLPIYGIGALGIYALKPLKNNFAVLFLLCVGLSGVIEYIIGWAGIQYFGLRLWDYSHLFLNINGIVCFRSVMSFGIMGLVFHYVLEPLGEKMYHRMSGTTIHVVCFITNLKEVIPFGFLTKEKSAV